MREISILFFSYLYSGIVKNCLYCHCIQILPDRKLLIEQLINNNMTSSWEIDGETVETVSDFIFGGSKITAGGDCSHEIKRRLLLERSYDQPR